VGRSCETMLPKNPLSLWIPPPLPEYGGSEAARFCIFRASAQRDSAAIFGGRRRLLSARGRARGRGPHGGAAPLTAPYCCLCSTTEVRRNEGSVTWDNHSTIMQI